MRTLKCIFAGFLLVSFCYTSPMMKLFGKKKKICQKKNVDNEQEMAEFPIKHEDAIKIKLPMKKAGKRFDRKIFDWEFSDSSSLKKFLEQVEIFTRHNARRNKKKHLFSFESMIEGIKRLNGLASRDDYFVLCRVVKYYFPSIYIIDVDLDEHLVNEMNTSKQEYENLKEAFINFKKK